jgi:hypothetical protein
VQHCTAVSGGWRASPQAAAATRARRDGRPVPLPEPFNPQDREASHAAFASGPAMTARVRVLEDLLVAPKRGSPPGERI